MEHLQHGAATCQRLTAPPPFGLSLLQRSADNAVQWSQVWQLSPPSISYPLKTHPAEASCLRNITRSGVVHSTRGVLPPQSGRVSPPGCWPHIATAHPARPTGQSRIMWRLVLCLAQRLAQ